MLPDVRIMELEEYPQRPLSIERCHLPYYSTSNNEGKCLHSTISDFSEICLLKLYCFFFNYTRTCVINCIWGLKTMITCEWPCLISFASDPLSILEQAGVKNIQNENICLQRDSNPRQRFRPLGHHALMIMCGLLYRIVG